MNPNPNQPDPANPPDDVDAIDASLLNEALAEPTPAQLEAKIIALTDPQMLSLLDEAMAPEALPEGLNDRILAVTAGSVATAASSASSSESSPAVVARIGPATLRYAAAAAIALAVGLGVWFANQPSADTDASIAGIVDTPSISSDEASDDADAPDWLTDEYAAADTTFFDAGLDDVAERLDDVSISRDTLWSELDAYEQFLSDMESDDV